MECMLEVRFSFDSEKYVKLDSFRLLPTPRLESAPGQRHQPTFSVTKEGTEVTESFWLKDRNKITFARSLHLLAFFRALRPSPQEFQHINIPHTGARTSSYIANIKPHRNEVEQKQQVGDHFPKVQ